jgi:plastocyanin
MPRAWLSCTATEQYPAWRRAFLGALFALLARAAAAGEMQATVTSADGQPLADAVVVAIAADGGAAAPAAPPPSDESVDQIDKEFVPYVKVVRAGTAVHFPNKDHIRHHVYSFSPARVFELPLYAGTPAEPVVFDKPGIVTLGCNIHDWMIGYIYVTDSPWSGKTGEDGRVTFGALPPGNYRVHVWHPRMVVEESSTMVDVAVAGSALATQAWKLELKPDLRRRRAPVMGTGGYR